MFFATIMRVVVLLLVLLALMSITPPTLAVTTTAAATLPVEPDGGSGGQPGEPGGRPNTTPPRSDSSSDGPFIQFQGRLPGNGTGIENNNTRVIPATSPPPATNTTTTTPVTKTDTFITATINGSRFANNDTIAINGTVGGHATPSNTGKLYVEVKDPHNETVMYDSTNMTTLGNTKSPFSYKFVAGELDANTTTTNPSRTVLKPMNESGLNYTMTVGYRMLGTSPSEVDFVFAYDPDGGVGGGPTTVASQFAGNNTTTTTTTTTQAPVIPPQPVLDESDDDDDDSSSSSSDDDDDGSDSSSDNDDSDDDDNDDSRDALEILKDVLNREPPRDVDEDDD